MFEALIMAMVREMPVNAVAGLVGEYDMRIWRVVHHYVDLAVEAQDLRGVFVVEGKDHETVQAFSLFLETHGGDPGAGQGGVPGHVLGVPEGHPEISPERRGHL